MSDIVEFVSIVREVRAKSLVSLDKSYRIMLETEDPNVVELGRWPADETVSVKIVRNKV
jgi:hypothetical protein